MKTDNKPLFTLTAEEVEIVKNTMELQRKMALELADALEPEIQHTETTLDNLLNRIKKWENEVQKQGK